MALRVLLADESSTIKKVMMLALQDFAVEVKSVPVGLDVLAVTKTYKPDIIFADVLLTKRNGYEVAGDLKRDPETSPIPVVLMWSGFMELDEVKASESRADRRLEKPFDAETLRGLVHDLVKKTRSNPLSEYLTFPQMPEFEEKRADPSAAAPADFSTHQLHETPPSAAVREDSLGDIYAIPEESQIGVISHLNRDELEMPQGEEFSQVPLTSTPKALDAHRADAQEEGGWSHQDLSKFKIQVPPSEMASDDFAAKFVIPQEELSEAHVQVSGNFEEISFDTPKAKTRPTAAPNGRSNMTNMEMARPTPPPASAIAETQTSIRLDPAPYLSHQEIKPERREEQRRQDERRQPPAAEVRQDSVKFQSGVDMNSDMMEKIIREQARELIESICWKVLPDIAERVVREEIQKILRDT